ncbi:MAG: hypothetical protein SGPRY_005200 [Prymnesium sp.]
MWRSLAAMKSFPRSWTTAGAINLDQDISDEAEVESTARRGRSTAVESAQRKLSDYAATHSPEAADSARAAREAKRQQEAESWHI